MEGTNDPTSWAELQIWASSRNHHGIAAPEVQRNLRGHPRRLITSLHTSGDGAGGWGARCSLAAPSMLGSSPSYASAPSRASWMGPSRRHPAEQALWRAELEDRVVREGFLEELAREGDRHAAHIWKLIIRAQPAAPTPCATWGCHLLSPELETSSVSGDTARKGSHFPVVPAPSRSRGAQALTWKQSC